jgi:hypothetical protein
MPQESALFSGDHVMAWSTSVVAPLDGAMRHYTASLEKLLARDEKIYWPASQGAATFCPRAPLASPRAGNRDPLPDRGLRLDDSRDRRQCLRGPRPGAYQRGRLIGPRSHRGSRGARARRDRRSGPAWRPLSNGLSQLHWLATALCDGSAALIFYRRPLPAPPRNWQYCAGWRRNRKARSAPPNGCRFASDRRAALAST